MKQSKKNYLFLNFESDISNKKVLKSDLKIENIYNLKADRGIIEPVCNFTSLFEDVFSEDQYQTFIYNNQNLIKNILYSTIYEYEDPETKLPFKRLFALDKDFYLYELNFKTILFESLSINFSKFPQILSTNGKLYFYNENENFVMIDCYHSPICLTDVPNLTNITSSNIYTYFTVNNKSLTLYYTELTELENLTNELENYDSISVNPDGGKILKLISYKDTLYIIQQYSISKIYITSKTIRPVISCEISSKIYENTICLIDDYIVFLSTAGLFVFDGNDIKPLLKNLTINLSGQSFIAQAYNNLYYLACNLYINEISERVLIEYNIESDTCNIYKIGNIINLYTVQTFNHYELIAILNSNAEYQVLKRNKSQLSKYSKYIKFNKLTFDNTYVKVLNSIKFTNFGKFKIIINSDLDSVIFDACDNFEAGNIGLKGHIFEIEIISESSFYIESIYAEILSMEE